MSLNKQEEPFSISLGRLRQRAEYQYRRPANANFRDRTGPSNQYQKTPQDIPCLSPTPKTKERSGHTNTSPRTGKAGVPHRLQCRARQKISKEPYCFFANKHYLCRRKTSKAAKARQKPAAATPGFPGRNTNRFPQGSSNGGMVDTKDLKSFGHCGCAGSSPASSTTKPHN